MCVYNLTNLVFTDSPAV